MKLKFTRKAGIAVFLSAVLIFTAGGLALDRFAGSRFKIEKLPEGMENEASDIASDAAVFPDPDTPEKSGDKININTADKETLCELKGIGEKTAEKIIAYRMANGDFEAIEEITNVKGIGNAKFNNIKENICVK